MLHCSTFVPRIPDHNDWGIVNGRTKINNVGYGAAKHAILKRYLQAWMVILSQGKFPEILYIDGFAGPGQYKNGEKGSPIIALENALNYHPPLTAKIHFLFVEKDPDRAAHLS